MKQKGETSPHGMASRYSSFYKCHVTLDLKCEHVSEDVRGMTRLSRKRSVIEMLPYLHITFELLSCSVACDLVTHFPCQEG